MKRLFCRSGETTPLRGPLKEIPFHRDFYLRFFNLSDTPQRDFNFFEFSRRFCSQFEIDPLVTHTPVSRIRIRLSSRKLEKHQNR